MSWPKTRLRYVVDVNPPVRPDLLVAPDTRLSFLPMEAIGEDGSLKLDRTCTVTEARSGYSYFEDGDVVFAKVTPCFENGKGAIMRTLEGGAGFGTTEITVLRPKKGTNAGFLNYVLQSERFRQLGVGAMTGAGGLKRVPDDFARNFSVAWPTVFEQERIANFLDVKTARIDSLILEKEQLKRAVREYEQAETCRVLTTGLKGAPLLKTGRNFFPEAPVGWRVTVFKRALHGMSQGWSPQCENRSADENEWGVLKVGCVNGTTFDGSQNKALPTSLKPDLTCVLRAGDVLVSRANTRELVGMAALVDVDYPNLLLCDKLYRLRLREDWVLPEYAVLVLRSEASRRQIELGASGASSSMQNIAQDVIRELLVAFPPLDEQRDIVSKAEQIRISCDNLVDHSVQHIARLQEYRSSLISATVTGQLDFRSLEEAA